MLVKDIAHTFAGIFAPFDTGFGVIKGDKTAFFADPLSVNGKQIYISSADRADLGR
jgi:hypothetical protein